METIRVKTHVGEDGILKLKLPSGVVNCTLDVVIVLQPVDEHVVDALGWPAGYFERTYGSMANDPMERLTSLEAIEVDQ